MNIYKIFLYLIFFSISVISFSQEEEEDESFSDVKIRVVRPRYFVKRFKFELGAQTAILTNDSYLYSFLGIANINFHISELFSLGVNGGYGISMKKSSTEILRSVFKVTPSDQVEMTYLISGRVMWTPMYGKYQVSSGKLVYFDTYFSYTFTYLRGLEVEDLKEEDSQ